MPPTTVIRGYTLGELIGRGGMGSVYRARQGSLERTVAVKLLEPALAADPKLLARFHTEAVAGGRLHHPNVARVLDHGVAADGTPFIAMEHVEGDRLGAILDREGALAPRRACAIVGQVLAALDAAHAAGIIHADVKADNLLVAATPEGERVTLIDFGIARLLDQPLLEAGPERVLSGTPEYLAPEVIHGGPPTAESDVYATGVLLYELLTGAPPFSDDAPAAVCQHHLHDAVVAPSLRSPDAGITPALDAVVLRALAKAPERRHPSAAAFATALAAAIPTHDVPVVPHAPASSVDTPTLDWPVAEHRRAGAAGRAHPLDRLEERRAHVGAAIAHGDPRLIAAAYIELARTLVAAGQVDLATWELEEAVDVMTAGSGPDAEDPPPHLWHVLLALSSIHADHGALAPARTAAHRARAAALRTHSVVGAARSRAALHRLRATVARTRAER